MSILDTVFRRREPPPKYRTIDGGHPAPYPDMTDAQLYNYETTFNVPKKTFDKPPPAETTVFARTEPQLHEIGKTSVLRTKAPGNGMRTSGVRGGETRTVSGISATRPNPASSGDADEVEELPPARSLREPPEPDGAPVPLDWSKPVRTVTTRQVVEVITTRARHPVFKVLGYIGEDQVATMFTLDGQISENGPRFLENVPQKQALYLNIYPNRDMGGRERFLITQHETKEAADAAATVERIACVPVEFDLCT